MSVSAEPAPTHCLCVHVCKLCCAYVCVYSPCCLCVMALPSMCTDPTAACLGPAVRVSDRPLLSLCRAGPASRVSLCIVRMSVRALLSVCPEDPTLRVSDRPLLSMCPAGVAVRVSVCTVHMSEKPLLSVCPIGPARGAGAAAHLGVLGGDLGGGRDCARQADQRRAGEVPILLPWQRFLTHIIRAAPALS